MKRLMLFLLVGMLASCGDPDSKLNSGTNGATNNDTNNGGDECVFDADCPAAFACEASLCVPVCNSDADCVVGEVCEPGTNTEATVCQVGPTNSQNIEPNNIVNTNNIATNDTTVYYVARILSVTTGEDACAGFDPGPDIFGVSLESDAGEVLGWGNVVWDDVQFEDNDFVFSAHLDGSAIDLGGDICPDFNPNTVVALGCENENYVAVEFVDGDGNPVALDATANQVIHIYEWGTQCSEDGVSDEYNVDICTDTAGVKMGDPSSCDINVLIGAEGEEFGNVTGF